MKCTSYVWDWTEPWVFNVQYKNNIPHGLLAVNNGQEHLSL